MDTEKSENCIPSCGAVVDEASCSSNDNMLIEESIMDTEKSENDIPSCGAVVDEASCSSNANMLIEESIMHTEKSENDISSCEAVVGEASCSSNDNMLIEESESHKIEDTNLSDCEEIVVEENFIQVSLEDPDEISFLNSNSNVRLIALESDSPALQVESKVFHFHKWKYVQGTAMFFEPKKVEKTNESLYDKNCESDLKYIGSTRKCLEMTKKDSISHSD